MYLSEIIIRKVNSSTRLVASADITLSNMIAIRDIKIIETANDNEKRLFLAMPSKSVPNGFKDIAHPISKEVRTSLETLIIGGYEILNNENLTSIEMAYKNLDDHPSLLNQTMDSFYFIKIFKSEQK